MADKRTFNFFRAGGFDQVRLESGKDLQALGELDQKLWVALACPTKGLAFDARTLELIDTDKDGRIRAPELIAAAKWACELMKNPDELVKPGDALALASINTDVEEGKLLQQAAKTVLAGLGRADATGISVKDSADAVKAFDGMAFNGDGVLPPESAKDDATKQLIADIVACTGGTADKSGKQGASGDNADAFFKAVSEHAAWLDQGTAETQPLGADTAAAFEAVKAVRAKVDDFFARCRLAAFDERAIAALNREEKEYLALAAKDLTITSAEIQSFPLARIAAGKALPLKEGVNPAWAAAIATLTAKAVKPLVGDKVELGEADWATVTAKLAPYEAWQGGKAGPSVEKLGADRVRALAKADARKPFDALMAEEKAQEPTAKSIASVEKLVRLHRDLFRLANNFVSFKDFYARKTPAIFQVGRLFLDQRECELCIRVEDAGKHATMAPLSRVYLAYCDCTRPTGEKMTIVAAFTAGDSDNLMVGRNGIFYDRDGRDWDATITKVVENPISIRQAFWSPYKKLVRFVEEQVAKRAATADTESSDKLTGAAAAVEKSADAGKAQPPARKFDVGVVAALGVAVGGITAALGAMLETFFGLGLWMPLGFVGLLFLISGPSMLIAALKLRQRNIGPLLDANGWAVNARARLNIPFGGALTKVAVLPPGSSVDTFDPFADKRRPWGLYITLAVILGLGLGWYLGKLDKFLPQAARSAQVLGKNAPAWEAPEADAPKADAPAAPEAAPAAP